MILSKTLKCQDQTGPKDQETRTDFLFGGTRMPVPSWPGGPEGQDPTGPKGEEAITKLAQKAIISGANWLESQGHFVLNFYDLF